MRLISTPCEAVFSNAILKPDEMNACDVRSGLFLIFTLHFKGTHVVAYTLENRFLYLECWYPLSELNSLLDA